MRNQEKKKASWRKQENVEMLLARFRDMMGCFFCNDMLENLLSQADPARVSDNTEGELSLEELDFVAAAGHQAVMKKIDMEKRKHDY